MILGDLEACLIAVALGRGAASGNRMAPEARREAGTSGGQQLPRETFTGLELQTLKCPVFRCYLIGSLLREVSTRLEGTHNPVGKVGAQGLFFSFCFVYKI